MADMALSLTKTAVEGTVGRVLAAIDEDTKLKAAAQQDLRFIFGEFQMMQSFLKVAKNNKERTSNEVVKTWVRQLRELAFDVEDCVEFVIHLDTTSHRCPWVWRVLPLPSCMTPAWTADLDQAVAQLKQLKSRVEEISQRNTRYNLLGGDDSGSSTTTPPVPPEQLAAAAFPSTVDILRGLWKANAKQSSLLNCNLKDLMAHGRCSELRVISLWRSAGVDLEASHIVNMAYRDPEICKQFKARARVKLMHPFNIQEFLKTLLNQLYVTSRRQDTLGVDLLRTNRDSYVQDELRQLLSRHKYLIILEDLSSMEEWDLIRFYLPNLHNGSRIVISTEQLWLALSCTGEPYRALQLALFPNDRYIYAFYKSSDIGMTELLRQLGQRRVISLWGDEGGDTSSLVRDVYKGIRKKTAYFKGVSFEQFLWVDDVPTPFILEDFCRRLPDYDSYRNPESYLEDRCCLVVINGLQSQEHWDQIKVGLVPEDTKSCIVIIANEEVVAKHCEDNSSRKMRAKEHKEANEPSGIDITELVTQLGQRRMISLWGDKDLETLRLVYEAMENKAVEFKGVNFEQFLWVHVPSPFSLEDFCRCLPRFNGDPKSYFAGFWRKEVCEDRSYLVVIHGLQSKEDWDKLKDAGLVPEHTTKSCIVVIIANEEEVANNCQDNNSLREMDDEEQEEANDAAIIGPLFAQKEEHYSWGHSFGSHGRGIEGLSLFEPYIAPEQELLLRDIHKYRLDQYGVFAVWGATGVGKSALVRFVYYTVMAYSLEIIEKTKLPKREVLMQDPRGWTRFDRFGWVDVPEPFDLAELSRRLLLDFNSYDPVEMEKTAVDIIQGHNPIQRCYETIRNHRCLVVIDGLRSTRDWDSIKQAFWCHHHPESCIFVITIEESVAKHCIKNYDEKEFRAFSFRALDDKSALELFTKVAKQQKESTTKQNWKHPEHIVPKCGGLPKIIDAMARSPYSFWENIKDDLVTKLKNDPQFDNLRGVLSWMHSYIDGCSDSINPCIFYLSVFPTKYKIRKAHLRRRWITEGYCRDTTGCSAKENAESLFMQLAYLDIIQYIGSYKVWQVNGFFREYIISQPMEDNLVFALEGHCKPKSQRIVQHLTIMESWEREKHVFESIDVSRLRSLTVYGKWKPFFISEKMKRIRVLDLEGTTGVEDCCIQHIFEILLSLKFICLRGCKSITCLPKTLGGLRQLESLDVSGTSIVTLPWDIIKLQKIQYIRAGRKFLLDEDCTSAASEVGGQKKWVGCCWTSTKSSQGSDDVVGSQQPSGTTATPEAECSDDAVGSQQPSGTTATPEAEGSDDAVGSQQPSGTTATPEAKCSDDAVGSQQPSGTTATPEAECSDGDHQGQHQHHKQRHKKINKVGRSWTSRLSSSLSPLTPCSWFAHNNINGGVAVPVGIEDMPALHTLGIVNINSARGMDFLNKLKDKTKLPQLVKLSVCGINNKNWKDLCGALSAHDHLESLSLGLDKDFTENNYFGNPPKALKSFKVYGHIHRLPDWIKDGRLVTNLEKFEIEAIISSQEGMDQLVKSMPRTRNNEGMDQLVESVPRTRNNDISHRLCIKPTRQVKELEFKEVDFHIWRPRVLKIDCSSPLEVAFQKCSIAEVVDVLMVHCAKGSDFRISSNEKRWLNHVDLLKTVWLKGYDEEAEYVAHLKEQIAAHPHKPVFKLF